MQPDKSITKGSEVYDLTLLDLSPDYEQQRPWLVAALGVAEEDLCEWERSSSVPPKIEAISFDEEDGDFEVAPPRGGETEFILDDPDAEEDEDEDADSDESDEDEDSDDEEDDESEDQDDDESEQDDDPDANDEEFGEGLDDDDVILEDDDGERD